MVRRLSRRARNRPASTPGKLLWLLVAASLALGMVFYLKCRTTSIAESSTVEQANRQKQSE